MKQLVFNFYQKILEQEACVELMKAAIVNDSYNKKNYPKCLKNLSEEESVEALGKNTFNNYKEDKDWNKVKSGHLVVLRSFKEDEKSISIERMVLDGCRRGYQREMICDLVSSCLLMPEEILYHHIFEKKSIKQLSRIFQTTEEWVKLRLIKFYYDNVILILKKHME